jgi:hypothetical protein
MTNQRSLPLKWSRSSSCAELKVDSREAREKLRLAARDLKKNPELSKLHKPGHTWEWPKNSAALKEARAALSG